MYGKKKKCKYDDENVAVKKDQEALGSKKCTHRYEEKKKIKKQKTDDSSSSVFCYDVFQYKKIRASTQTCRGRPWGYFKTIHFSHSAQSWVPAQHLRGGVKRFCVVYQENHNEYK